MTAQAMVEELRSHLEDLARWTLSDLRHNRNSPLAQEKYHKALRMLELFDALHARGEDHAAEQPEQLRPVSNEPPSAS